MTDNREKPIITDSSEEIKNVQQNVENNSNIQLNYIDKYVKAYLTSLSSKFIKPNTENEFKQNLIAESIRVMKNLRTMPNIANIKLETETMNCINNLLCIIELNKEINYKHHVKITFDIILHYFELGCIKEPENVLFIKAVFHEYITHNKMIELIEIYNKIFTDNEFGTSDVLQTNIDIPQSWKEDQIITYTKKMAIERSKIFRSKKEFARFEVVDVNLENVWKMSEILDVLEYQGRYIYYIRTLGYDGNFEHFITNSNQIKRYNPRNHIYDRKYRVSVLKTDKPEAFVPTKLVNSEKILENEVNSQI